MEYKFIKDLSFFSDEQKEWFKEYIIYENGNVINEKTGKEVAKTIHGSRGYVVNLSIYVNGERKQRQIIIHRAVADLFIRSICDDEKIVFKDGDKLNTNSSNLFYEKTEKAKNAERVAEATKEKGITEDGRNCSSCGEFKLWKDIAGDKSAICKKCASKRGMEYQKSVGYSKGKVKYETYANRLSGDSPIDVGGYLGFACSICKNVFLIARSKVLNRIKSIKIGYNTKPLVCPKCEKGE